MEMAVDHRDKAVQLARQISIKAHDGGRDGLETSLTARRMRQASCGSNRGSPPTQHGPVNARPSGRLSFFRFPPNLRKSDVWRKKYRRPALVKG